MLLFLEDTYCVYERDTANNACVPMAGNPSDCTVPDEYPTNEDCTGVSFTKKK